MSEQHKVAGIEAPVFDPASLRLSQNFHESLGVKKALITVPVRKPGKQDFIRVHPDWEGVPQSG